MRARSCPTCHSIGAPIRGCGDGWHNGGRTAADVAPSHVFVEVPTVRPADPLAKEIGDRLHLVTRNYEREGSGPGSRFEGQLLEDVLAVAVMHWLAEEGRGDPFVPLPAGMTVNSLGEPVELICRDHGVVLAGGEISLRTLSFEARRHWREKHPDG